MKSIKLIGDTVETRNSWLHNTLSTGTYDVTFTKVNGETRVMPCTLKESLIPQLSVHVTNTNNPVDFPAVKKEKQFKPDTLRVWCLDKKEWRSFRVMSVTEVKESNYGK